MSSIAGSEGSPHPPSAGSEPVLTVDRASRRFGDHLAVDEVSFAVLPGEIRALLGPNGAGKTTLLRMLSGLTAPTSGSVHVLGSPVDEHSSLQRGRVGLIPSGDRTFYLRLTGLQNLVFFARLHGMTRRDAKANSLKLLERVGLEGAADRPVGKFSHGMHKRLAIARALMTGPKVLLVDEATHDLDPAGAARVRALVRNAADEGAAVLWTTQRLEEIRGFADSVTVLAEGKVRFQGGVLELIARSDIRSYILDLGVSEETPPTESVEKVLAGTAQVRPLQGDKHLVTLESNSGLGDVVARLLAAGFHLNGCREERSEIEDAFMRLTSRWDG